MRIADPFPRFSEIHELIVYLVMSKIKMLKQKARLRRLFVFRKRRWKKYRNKRRLISKIDFHKRLNIPVVAKAPVPEVIYQIKAPADFRFLVNTKVCKEFFEDLRSRAYEIHKGKYNEINIDFKDVAHIDFSSTMVLCAIRVDLKSEKTPCYMKGRLPDRNDCAQYIRDSGFLDGMSNGKGILFKPSGASQRMQIKRGQEKIHATDLTMFAEISERVYRHLTGKKGSELYHSEMLKEICGNSVDWSDSKHGHFTIGAKYEDGKVIMVALDLGIGILKSLELNFLHLLRELFQGNSHIEILLGAFRKKYGSKSLEPNRNKGLPSFKYANETGRIKNLQVVTNNVLLSFDNSAMNYMIEPRLESGFKGTLYSWIIDRSCLNK